MLTFTPSQMTQLQQIWQLDQLLLSMPEILPKLQQKFPDFWSLSTAETHQRYYTTQADKLVNNGMAKADWLEQLLSLEYQYQCPVTKKPWLELALKLDWLIPDDRLDLIGYLFRLQQQYTLSDPFPYESFSVYPLKHRLIQIACFLAAPAGQADLSMQLPNVLRQGLYYALLKSALQAQGWQACHSDWKKTSVALQHPTLQRSVHLQSHASDSDHDFKLKTAPLEQSNCLTITIPLQLNESRIETLFNYLKAWCVNLEPSSSETFRVAMAAGQDTEEEGQHG